MRYFIKLAYNGKNYHGWQIQPNAISVQEKLNEVFSTLLQQKVNIMGAGRTDTGVHAKMMYGHFDVVEALETNSLLYKVNSFLPNDIVIDNLIPVHEEAHARFDAVSRTYEYHIATKKEIFNPDLVWLQTKKLDVNLMNQAAKLLFSFQDFKCFSKTHTEVNTYICNITEAYWEDRDNLLIFTITADRFLRNMVRAIVGTLINIGLHKITLSDFIKIIEERKREKAGFSVPAQGLFLTNIKYPYLV